MRVSTLLPISLVLVLSMLVTLQVQGNLLVHEYGTLYASDGCVSSPEDFTATTTSDGTTSTNQCTQVGTDIYYVKGSCLPNGYSGANGQQSISVYGNADCTTSFIGSYTNITGFDTGCHSIGILSVKLTGCQVNGATATAGISSVLLFVLAFLAYKVQAAF